MRIQSVVVIIFFSFYLIFAPLFAYSILFYDFYETIFSVFVGICCACSFFNTHLSSSVWSLAGAQQLKSVMEEYFLIFSHSNVQLGWYALKMTTNIWLSLFETLNLEYLICSLQRIYIFRMNKLNESNGYRSPHNALLLTNALESCRACVRCWQ